MVQKASSTYSYFDFWIFFQEQIFHSSSFIPYQNTLEEYMYCHVLCELFALVPLIIIDAIVNYLAVVTCYLFNATAIC